MQTQDHQILDVLTRQGVLIKVSVHYWRGCNRLKAEDLGLDSTLVSERLITLGQKRLLPKEALKELALVEGRAHALVDQNTFPFLNGIAHFLPNGKLGEVSSSLQGLEASFWEAKRDFIQQYSQLRQEAAQEWRSMASKLVRDPEIVVARVEASFPMVHRLDKMFGFNVNLFQIRLPDHAAMDVVAMEDQREVMEARQKATEEAAAKIRRETEQFIMEAVASMREQTATLCADMLESINGSEAGVHQKTLNRLSKFIDQFRQMNFAGDNAMDQQLEAVRKELLSKTAAQYRDSAYARTQLVDGLSKLRDKAAELAKADVSHIVQRFGELGRRKFTLAA